MDTLAQKIKLRMSQLEEVKRDYENRDYQIARYVNPRRELLKSSQRFDNKGLARGKDSYSGVPNSALGVWCDGMQGHMVSQSIRWFKGVINDFELSRNDEVQAYLQRYDEVMYNEFNESNFYAILGEWFRDAGSIGTATLFTEEDISRQVAVHIPIHPREVFISEDRYGNVDTVYRKFFLTAKQAVNKFGEENLSKNILNNTEEEPEKRHEFIHAVFPNTDRMFGSILSIHKSIISIYMEVNSDRLDNEGIVRKSGFDINPYAVWRLRKNSDEIYGYSPAADAMNEIKKSHQLSKTLLRAAHMAVASPLNVPEHMRGNTRIEPDGKNYFERGGDKISAIYNNNNYPVAIDREEKVQRIIEDAYRVDFFLILARAEREMTATEIMERQSEKAVLLGPQVDRLEKEGLAKVFDIVSDIAEKAGKFKDLDPPDVLIEAVESGRTPKIDIRFTGPLAQAQRRIFQMQPIKNGINELAQVSVVFPKVLDRIDPDKLAERILDSTDFPQDVMHTDDEMKELREQQERELAEAKQQQALMGAADAYGKVTKKPEEDSPAEMIGAELGA